MRFEIVIPTRDSARWIGEFLKAYRQIGVEPLYIVDTRSTDATEAILRKAGARVETYTCKANYIEAGTVEFARDLVAKDWTFRVDDDEFPSLDLLRWMEEIGCSTKGVTSWLLSRLELVVFRGAVKYSRHPSMYRIPELPDLSGPQLRLYRHRSVEYIEAIHTTGIQSDGWRCAPTHLHFVHMDKLLRSFGERLEKIRRYEDEKRGSTWRYGYTYLPELLTEKEHKAAHLPTKEFANLIASLPRPLATDTSITPEEIELVQRLTEDDMRFLTERRAAIAEQQRLQKKEQSILACQPIAEFFCTLGRGLHFVDRHIPRDLRISHHIEQYGRQLFHAAEMKRINDPNLLHPNL